MKLSLATASLALLGLLAMPLSSHADDDAPTAKRVKTQLLSDFTDATPDFGWIVVNDGVMGGRSQGDYERRGGGIDFAGTTNTNGGGFSSIRTRGVELDLGGFDGIRVRVRGDGRRYTWRLTTDARWRGRQVGYWADFETVEGEWVEADIPFSRFAPQWRGRMLSDLPLDPSKIRGMGLMIYDKRDGPFEIRMESVSAYRSASPFRLSELRWEKRVLVAYASAASDAELLEQLASVEATRKAFDERDMALVVIVETAGSHVDGRRIDTDAALRVRRDLRFEPGAFGLRLLGKDGGVKRAATGPVAMREIYDLIDSMPMRQAEMERRAGD